MQSPTFLKLPGNLLTSEIISIDGGVEEGPDLPTAVQEHAITSFNSTVSILSGGMTSATNWSPLTWLYNHETQTFSSGPSLIEGRSYVECKMLGKNIQSILHSI